MYYSVIMSFGKLVEKGDIVYYIDELLFSRKVFQDYVLPVVDSGYRDVKLSVYSQMRIIW